MRKILNISLSKDLAEIVKKEVEQGDIALCQNISGF